MQRWMRGCCVSRAGLTLRGSLPAPASSSLALSSSVRGFVQGGPPIPKKDIDKSRKRYLVSSHADEMEAKHQRCQREVDEYYATHDPGHPTPLPENSFVKGQFGMRRRYHVDHRGVIDSVSLGSAMDEGTNAMRK